MKLDQIQPNALVSHPEKGVGRITAVKGSHVSLRFNANPDDAVNMSKSEVIKSCMALPADGLEASLENNREEVLAWANSAPLRLIGATLADLTGNEARPRELQRMLEGRVLTDVTWKTWWEKVRPAAQDSGYFRVEAAKPVKLIVPVANITNEPPRRAPSRRTSAKASRPKGKSSSRASSDKDLPVWIKWLWATEEAPLPGTIPPDGLSELVEGWPAEIFDRCYDRLIAGALEALGQPRLTPRTKELWLGLITRAHSRHRACTRPAASAVTARPVPRLLQSLISITQDSARLSSLFEEASKLAEQAPWWRQDLMAGIWHSFRADPDLAKKLMHQLTDRRDAQARAVFYGDLMAAAFTGPAYATRNKRNTDLDSIVSPMRNKPEHAMALRHLIWRAAGAELRGSEVADYLRHAVRSKDQNTRFNLMITAALLLPEGNDEMLSQAVALYQEALTNVELEPASPGLAALLNAAREKIQESKQQREEELSRQRAELEGQLAEQRKHELNLKQRVRTLQADRAAGRQESRFEARKDMLLRIGDMIQGAYISGKSPESKLEDVMARLPLVVQDAEAELFGQVGETVGFDPKNHYAAGKVSDGTPVVLAAPGVVVHGRAGDQVVLRARVEQSAEVN